MNLVAKLQEAERLLRDIAEGVPGARARIRDYEPMAPMREVDFHGIIGDVYRDRAVQMERTAFTSVVQVDKDSSIGYESYLVGPFADSDTKDVRLWISIRYLRGTVTLELVVQDRDDDAWLNSNAIGSERYKQDKIIYVN